MEGLRWRKDKPDFTKIEWVIPSEEFPRLGLRKSFLSKENNYVFKSFLDMFFSITTTILLFPLYIILGVLIKLNSKGPVLIKQERIGFDGKTFKILKFRTMYYDAEERKKSLC